MATRCYDLVMFNDSDTFDSLSEVDAFSDQLVKEIDNFDLFLQLWK